MFLVVGLFAAVVAAGMLLVGAYCAAVVVVLGLPLVVLALGDHLATERRIRREEPRAGRGFEVRQIQRHG